MSGIHSLYTKYFSCDDTINVNKKLVRFVFPSSLYLTLFKTCSICFRKKATFAGEVSTTHIPLRFSEYTLQIIFFFIQDLTSPCVHNILFCPHQGRRLGAAHERGAAATETPNNVEEGTNTLQPVQYDPNLTETDRERIRAGRCYI